MVPAAVIATGVCGAKPCSTSAAAASARCDAVACSTSGPGTAASAAQSTPARTSASVCPEPSGTPAEAGTDEPDPSDGPAHTAELPPRFPLRPSDPGGAALG